MNPRPRRPADELTPREFEVVARFVAGRGMNDKYLAAELGLSVQTVRRYMMRVIHKVGADNRVGVALWFAETYPDEAAKKRAYMQACLRCCEARCGGRLKSK